MATPIPRKLRFSTYTRCLHSIFSWFSPENIVKLLMLLFLFMTNDFWIAYLLCLFSFIFRNTTTHDTIYTHTK
jgi:hypothetical protein